MNKFEKITANWTTEKTSLDIDMTSSQEKALIRAIEYKIENSGRMGCKILRDMELDQDAYGTICLTMTMTNGIKRSLGDIFPNRVMLFVGRKGGYKCYTSKKNGGLRRRVGRTALIYA